MLYQIMANDYINNGGGNMVTVCKVQLPAEKKTVWVSIAEGDCLITTVDIIRSNFSGEFIDASTKYACRVYDLDANNIYYRLIRHCLMLDAINVFEHCGATTILRFNALADELQSHVSLDYHEWCQEFNDGEYETDGYAVFEHAKYRSQYHRIKSAVK